MPHYLATYSLSSGREIREKIQGPGVEFVRVALRARGYFPTGIREIGTPAHQRRLRIPVKTLARLLRQLDLQLRAGVDEIGAVASLKDSHSSGKVRAMLAEVHASLAIAKTSFSDAFGAFPRVIPPHLRAIIAAGEGTGPENTADRLADVRDWLLFSDKIKRTFRKATTYPALLFGLASIYLVFFVLWFIPRFKVLIGSFGMPMPGYTQGILDGAEWLRGHGILLVVAVGLLMAACSVARRIEGVAALVDTVVLRLPVYRHVYQAIVTAQICRNYRALMLSGATAGEALKLCADMLSNRAARAEIRRVRREVVRDGANLGTALRRCGYFPPEAVSIIATAEQTGHLDQALREVSDEYEELARETVEASLAILTPLLVIATAAMVGAALTGLFLPIAKVFENLH
jgi:type II secretory pathway component PulF